MPVDMPIASLPVHNRIALAVLEIGTDGVFYTEKVKPAVNELSMRFFPQIYNPIQAADVWLRVARETWPKMDKYVKPILARYLERKYRENVFQEMTPGHCGFSYMADCDLIAQQEF